MGNAADVKPAGGHGQLEDDGRHGARNVFVLGLVSFFTDVSSEMIYPLVPGLLESMGVSKLVMGIIEGIAESTAALFRTVFGRMSDALGKRKLFVYLGYGLSAVSKPFLYVAGSWHGVLAVRFADRVGKAARSPARDALLSTSVSRKRRGLGFGFHRAMDDLGAVGGPLIAMGLLGLFATRGDALRLVFLLSFVPAGVALAFIPFAREVATGSAQKGGAAKSGMRSPAFVIFLIALVIFTLGNSTNMFLIARASEAGLPLTLVPAIWALYNLAGAAASPLFGTLSDRIGRRPVLALSFVIYAAVYAGFGLAQSLWAMWALFAAYGVHHGLSQGVAGAYVADLVEPEYRATAYGVLNTCIGLALVPASVIFGAVWDRFGSRPAFFMSAGMSVLALVVFLVSIGMKSGRKAG
jgi:MFS family permease